MIESREQLEQARGAISHLEDALAALRAKVGLVNPELFLALAEDYHSSIADLRGEIEEYLGIQDLANKRVALWMTLQGEALRRRDISSRLLSEWLSTLRKALYGVTTYMETGLVRLGGRPDAARLDQTDPRVLALQPGSIEVGLRLAEMTVQSDMFMTSNEAPVVYRALTSLLTVAEWATNERVSLPPAAETNPDELSVVARFAATLAPSERSSVRTVVFEGPLVPLEDHRLRLDAEARSRLKGLVQLLSHVTEDTVRGQIREIDLDMRRVILRERGPEMPDLKCYINEDNPELMAKAEKLLHRNVEVVGLISSATPEEVEVIDIVEEPH